MKRKINCISSSSSCSSCSSLENVIEEKVMKRSCYSKCGFFSCADDCLLEIYAYCDTRSLARLRSICKFFNNQLCYNGSTLLDAKLWHKVLINEFKKRSLLVSDG